MQSTAPFLQFVSADKCHFLKQKNMKENTAYNIDEATIKKVGLQLSDDPVNEKAVPGARVFKYPGLDGVYVMENDLYGNRMPEGSCFLAFEGKHGLVGQHLLVEKLRSANAVDIRKIIEANENG